MPVGAAIGQDGRDGRWEASWAGNHSSRCHPGCSWRVGSSAVPLVRVCAAGVGSVRSWRTWRRAFTTGFTLDMLKNGRFLRKLGETRFSQCDLRRESYWAARGVPNGARPRADPLWGRSRPGCRKAKIVSARPGAVWDPTGGSGHFLALEISTGARAYGQIGGYGLRWPRSTRAISARSRLGLESRSLRDRVCAARPPKAVATYL